MTEMTNTYKKAQALVAQMTLEEKMGQMLYQSPAIERLNIPTYNWWNESLHGVARAGVATMFPQAIGLAASFDKKLLYDVADAISTEGRAKFNAYSAKGDRGIYKGITFWAPNINIFRDPRWGRGHETFGEDTYLTAELGIEYIKGLQGEDSEHLKTTACAKHFAVHSGPESARHSFDAVVNKKDLYNIYLYAFERCVKEGKVEAVMGAYNRVNGEPACGSKTLLKDILRDKWGFQGHVVSDCWAIIDFHLHHQVTNSVEESAAMAVNNGCDLNCGNAFLYLKSAYDQGLITEDVITEAVTRLIHVRIRLGMLEEYPSPYDTIPYSKVECKEHIELALESTRRSVVLLKNDGVLPLNKKKLKTIAVIGPNANSREALIGNYVGTSSEYITPLEGIQRYVDDETRVLYAEGAHLYKDKVEELAEVNDRLAEALVTAEMSDVVIACLGLDSSLEGEEGDQGNAYASGDKADLNLPGNQQALLEALYATGKPVILIVSAGSALSLKWADEHVNAVMQAWYPGARGGKAITQLVFGEYSPSGKLPLTFYESTEELPSFEDYSMKNRTYRYMTGKATYPFGYGLSYSNVEYNKAMIERAVIQSTAKSELSVCVKNTGSYDIQEITQLYIKRIGDEEENYRLRGIETYELKAGENKNVIFSIDRGVFEEYDEDGNQVVLAGEYELYVGGQQPDRRSEELLGRTAEKLIITVA